MKRERWKAWGRAGGWHSGGLSGQEPAAASKADGARTTRAWGSRPQPSSKTSTPRLGSSTVEDPPLKRGMWVRLPPGALSWARRSKDYGRASSPDAGGLRERTRKMRVRVPSRPPRPHRLRAGRQYLKLQMRVRISLGLLETIREALGRGRPHLLEASRRRSGGQVRLLSPPFMEETRIVR